MKSVPLFLLCVLLPMLASCASYPKGRLAYAPPKVDCAIYDPPATDSPVTPAPTENSVVIWQMYGYAMQEYANGLLGQRLDSALCVKDLKDKGVVR